MTAGGGAHLELMTLRCFSFAAALALVACGGDDDRSEPPEATAGAEVTEGEVDVVMSEVVADALPETPVAVLSGPTFAAEVARGLPTAITLAAEDQDAAVRIQAGVGSGTLRAYLSDDPVGAPSTDSSSAPVAPM